MFSSTESEEMIRQWFQKDAHSFDHDFDMTTLQWMRSRRDPLYHLHYVLCQEKAGQWWRYIFFFERSSEKTPFTQLDMGGSHFPSPYPDNRLIHLHHARLAERFYAHGEISEKLSHATKIRLVSPDGLMLEDTAHNGLVIFASRERPEYPFMLELYNDAGQLIGQQTEGGLRWSPAT
ncbi:MAG: hypothetical protein H0V70_25680 [Ktedonobacteraceae bacterium]|nr:hypothetical protein [Ktedonobacteraceae bacterium]